MNVEGQHYITIWRDSQESEVVNIIDQRPLPHRFVVEQIASSVQMEAAIREMHVRGAPLIGAAAAYGLWLASKEVSPSSFREELLKKAEFFLASRPTAVNLAWAVNRGLERLSQVSSLAAAKQALLSLAETIVEEELERCRMIGVHGLELLRELSAKKQGRRLNVLTHCNAGWLACIDYGTATAPVYMAHDAGLDVHVWVDETRPRNQGARLTAWELGQHGVPHTVIADNSGGHLMRQGEVDLVIVGTDRTTKNGDVVNKIGTYLKALAAVDNQVPFYVALPMSSLDTSLETGREVPIEERSADEVRFISGRAEGGEELVRLIPEGSPAKNPAFDVTPARLVTGFITENGFADASEEGLRSVFPTAFEDHR